MFVENKYTKLYYKIISHYQANCYDDHYTEKHHIIPRSLGGDNSKENIVKLTAKAHFVCHHLLIKMTKDQNKIKMLHAFWRMMHSPQHSQKVTAKVYHSIREQRSKHLSKEMQGENNKFFGKNHTQETKRKMSDQAKNRCKTYGSPIGGFKKGNSPWNSRLSKDTDPTLKRIAELKKGKGNGMFGRTGKENPSSISFSLYNSSSDIVISFESRRSFTKYCQENGLPFKGLYKTLNTGNTYLDNSKNKRYSRFNGWHLKKT